MFYNMLTLCVTNEEYGLFNALVTIAEKNGDKETKLKCITEALKTVNLSNSKNAEFALKVLPDGPELNCNTVLEFLKCIRS